MAMFFSRDVLTGGGLKAQILSLGAGGIMVAGGVGLIMDMAILFTLLHFITTCPGLTLIPFIIIITVAEVCPSM